MLLTSDIPSDNLPGLNAKILGKVFSRRLLDKDMGLIYSELRKTLIYMLQHDDSEFYRNK